jgi:hypothetical protein
MTREQLVAQIRAKKSYLLVGLDSEVSKLPKHLQGKPDAVLAFNKQIIDARNLFSPYELAKSGWMYDSIGRPKGEIPL